MAAHEAIYEFAASIDTDDKGVAMGVDNVKDGVTSWGDDAVGNVGVGGWGGLNKKQATLVNGMLGNANCEDTIDQVFLPISMGYRSCYKRYMLLLGLNTKCAPDVEIVFMVFSLSNLNRTNSN